MKQSRACVVVIGVVLVLSGVTACVEPDLEPIGESGQVPEGEPDEMRDSTPDTFSEHIETYGFGVDVTDAYYLADSIAGTRLVVSITLTNESEPSQIQFAQPIYRVGYLTTVGAGDLNDEHIKQHNFAEEYQREHIWCDDVGPVGMGGAVECSMLFWKEGTTFDSIVAMHVPVRVVGTYNEIELKHTFAEQPRR